MTLRNMFTAFSRLNLSKAAREAVALKAEFRREDDGLYRQARGAEVLADRKRSLVCRHRLSGHKTKVNQAAKRVDF
jgi:hypothetical protein